MTQNRSIVATMKNEGPFLLEWIAYHRLIGFTNIVIFANDCEDGSDVMLQQLNDAGIIRYYDNSDRIAGYSSDPQNRAYQRAYTMDHVLDSEWILVLDADEFFNIHVGDGTLDALFAATGSCDIISGTWRVFGNSGQISYKPDLVMGQFTRAAPHDIQMTYSHFGLKTLFRPAPVKRIGIHRPFLKDYYVSPDHPLRWLNGSGDDVTDFYREKKWTAFPENLGYDLCQINHYMIKSNELFLLKRYRGTVNSSDPDRINFDYYDKFNSNHVTDDTMCRWVSPVNAEIEKLKSQHPDVAQSHAHCVAFFETKISNLVGSLKENDPEVYTRLMGSEAVQASIAQDEKWLSDARKPEGILEQDTRSVPKQFGQAVVRDQITSKVARWKVNALPDWLADMRWSNYPCGFYHADAEFAAHFAQRSQDVLIVSFDGIPDPKGISFEHKTLGFDAFRSKGWSHLGVFSFSANWYRDEALFEYLEDLSRKGFFAKFKKVIFTGVSMGGYAAAAFSALVPGCTVVAYCAQSTLSSDLTPWETRFHHGKQQSWDGRYTDAAVSSQAAQSVFLLYDPLFAPDKKHALRFAGPNVQHLKTWVLGEKSWMILQRTEIFLTTIQAAVEDTLTEASFYKMYRMRRMLPAYVHGLTHHALQKGHVQLSRMIVDKLNKDGRKQLAQAVQRRIERWT